MIGKNYLDISKNLYNSGWTCFDSEEGWSQFIKWYRDRTTVLEISYNANKVITDVYKYSY